MEFIDSLIEQAPDIDKLLNCKKKLDNAIYSKLKRMDKFGKRCNCLEPNIIRWIEVSVLSGDPRVVKYCTCCGGTVMVIEYMVDPLILQH